MKSKALVVASVASMIDQFNIPNIKLLQEMGYEVHVACNFIDGGTIPPEKTRELKNRLDKLDVIYFQLDFNRNPFNIRKTYKAYLQIKKVLENNYSLVHSHSPIGGALARLSARKYRKKGLKSIYTAHGFHFFKGAPKINWLIYYPVEKWLSRYTDYLITINKEDYKLAKSKFKAKQVIYIPGVGVDLSKFKPIAIQEKDDLRRKLGYKKEDFILIYVAELSYRKNQKMLLKTINKIKKDIPNLKLLLVGTGPLEEEYKDYIKNNNLDKYVDMLGYRMDIFDLMAISDLAVSTSKQEGLPVNVMEAMATGLPLIVANSRGNADLITKDNGIVVELTSTSKLADSILYLYKSGKTRKKYGQASLEKIEEYSISKILNLYKNIYK